MVKSKMSNLLESRNGADDNDQKVEEDNNTIPSYVVEIAKSSRAQCKKCDDKIKKKDVRVGKNWWWWWLWWCWW